MAGLNLWRIVTNGNNLNIQRPDGTNYQNPFIATPTDLTGTVSAANTFLGNNNLNAVQNVIIANAQTQAYNVDGIVPVTGAIRGALNANGSHIIVANRVFNIVANANQQSTTGNFFDIQVIGAHLWFVNCIFNIRIQDGTREAQVFQTNDSLLPQFNRFDPTGTVLGIGNGNTSTSYNFLGCNVNAFTARQSDTTQGRLFNVLGNTEDSLFNTSAEIRAFVQPNATHINNRYDASAAAVVDTEVNGLYLSQPSTTTRLEGAVVAGAPLFFRPSNQTYQYINVVTGYDNPFPTSYGSRKFISYEPRALGAANERAAQAGEITFAQNGIRLDDPVTWPELTLPATGNQQFLTGNNAPIAWGTGAGQIGGRFREFRRFRVSTTASYNPVFFDDGTAAPEDRLASGVSDMSIIMTSRFNFASANTLDVVQGAATAARHRYTTGDDGRIEGTGWAPIDTDAAPNSGATPRPANNGANTITAGDGIRVPYALYGSRGFEQTVGQNTTGANGRQAASENEARSYVTDFDVRSATHLYPVAATLTGNARAEAQTRRTFSIGPAAANLKGDDVVTANYAGGITQRGIDANGVALIRDANLSAAYNTAAATGVAGLNTLFTTRLVAGRTVTPQDVYELTRFIYAYNNDALTQVDGLTGPNVFTSPPSTATVNNENVVTIDNINITIDATLSGYAAWDNATRTLSIRGAGFGSRGADDAIRGLQLTGTSNAVLDPNAAELAGTVLDVRVLRNLNQDTSSFTFGAGLTIPDTGATRNLLVDAGAAVIYRAEGSPSLAGVNRPTTFGGTTLAPLTIEGSINDFTPSARILNPRSFTIEGLVDGAWFNVFSVTGNTVAPVSPGATATPRITGTVGRVSGTGQTASISGVSNGQVYRIVMNHQSINDVIVEVTVDNDLTNDGVRLVVSPVTLTDIVATSPLRQGIPADTVPAPIVDVTGLNAAGNVLNVTITSDPRLGLSASETSDLLTQDYQVGTQINEGIKNHEQYNNLLSTVDADAMHPTAGVMGQEIIDNGGLLAYINAASPSRGFPGAFNFVAPATGTPINAIGYVVPIPSTSSFQTATLQTGGSGDGGRGVIVYPPSDFDLAATTSSLTTVIDNDTFRTELAGPTIQALNNIYRLTLNSDPTDT